MDSGHASRHPPKPTVEDEDEDEQSHSNNDQTGEQGSANDGDAAPDEDLPPPPTTISISFLDASGNSVSFKLKPTTKLSKAMDAYSARTQRSRDTLRFFSEGTRLTNDSTPDSLEMVDGDTVEVHTEQIGGGDGNF